MLTPWDSSGRTLPGPSPRPWIRCGAATIARDTRCRARDTAPRNERAGRAQVPGGQAGGDGCLDCSPRASRAQTRRDRSPGANAPPGHSSTKSAVGLAEWQPGWRWSTHLAADRRHRVVPEPSPRLRHLRVARGHDRRRRGARRSRPGRAYEIPPGHDAWVVGDEPFVTVEWTSSRVVGVARRGARRARPRDGPVHRHRRLDGDARAHRRQRVAGCCCSATTRLMREVINTFRGREVTTTGDGFLVVFDGATTGGPLRGRDGARRRGRRTFASESASTPARSNRSPAMSEALPSTRRPGCWRWPGPMRS